MLDSVNALNAMFAGGASVSCFSVDLTHYLNPYELYEILREIVYMSKEMSKKNVRFGFYSGGPKPPLQSYNTKYCFRNYS